MKIVRGILPTDGYLITIIEHIAQLIRYEFLPFIIPTNGDLIKVGPGQMKGKSFRLGF